MITVGPTTDIAACQALRRTVFIEEQGVSETDELDGRDAEALHLLAWDGDAPVGTARLLVSGDIGKIGRVCVLPPYRKNGFGTALIGAALDMLRAQPGLTTARLGSQTHAILFYERLGFTAHGPVYDDAGIDHRDMDHPL